MCSHKAVYGFVFVGALYTIHVHALYLYLSCHVMQELFSISVDRSARDPTRSLMTSYKVFHRFVFINAPYTIRAQYCLNCHVMQELFAISVDRCVRDNTLIDALHPCCFHQRALHDTCPILFKLSYDAETIFKKR